MRTGRLLSWAGTGVLALLALRPASAQEPPPPPAAVTSGPPAVQAPLLPPRTGADPKLPAEPKPLFDAPLPPPGGPHAVPLPDAGHGGAEAVGGHGGEAAEGEGGYFQGLFFSGEYLLLRPRRNALDFAVSSPNLHETPGGSVESVNWETRSGYRIGAGSELPGKDWQVGLTYTYLFSRGDRSLASPAGGTLFATLTRGGGFDDVARADASTSINYNVLDLDFTRRICVQKNLDLTVFGGGRFAWIDQELDATYNGGSANAVNDHVHSPVYFRGAGLTVGSQAQWNVSGGLGLYARGRGGLLSGEFRDYLSETNNNGLVSIVNVRDKFQQIVPVTELGVGVAYQGDHWHLSVGYELTNWFNMINSPDFSDGSNIGKLNRRTGDLSLEGLAVQLGLIF